MENEKRPLEPAWVQNAFPWFMLVLRTLIQIPCQREEPVWCLGDRTHNHHLCYTQGIPLSTPGCARAIQASRERLLPCPGQESQLHTTQMYTKGNCSPGNIRGKKTKHNCPPFSPRPGVFWEYIGTPNILCVTLCKSKFLYRRKCRWMDSSTSQAEFK